MATMRLKQAQQNALSEAMRQMKRLHEWELNEANRNRAPTQAPVDANAHWAKNYAARYDKLSATLMDVLNSYSGIDPEVFEAALDAAKGSEK